MRVYPPGEALKHARPLPPRARLVVEDVPAEDWAAFLEVLAVSRHGCVGGAALHPVPMGPGYNRID
jgi:hypothetical protein